MTVNVTPAQIIDLMKQYGVKAKVNALDYERPLMEQNLDSLDMATTLFAIEEHFGIQIPPGHIVLEKLGSINAIVQYVRESEYLHG